MKWLIPNARKASARSAAARLGMCFILGYGYDFLCRLVGV